MMAGALNTMSLFLHWQYRARIFMSVDSFRPPAATPRAISLATRWTSSGKLRSTSTVTAVRIFQFFDRAIRCGISIDHPQALLLHDSESQRTRSLLLITTATVRRTYPSSATVRGGGSTAATRPRLRRSSALRVISLCLEIIMVMGAMNLPSIETASGGSKEQGAQISA